MFCSDFIRDGGVTLPPLAETPLSLTEPKQPITTSPVNPQLQTNRDVPLAVWRDVTPADVFALGSIADRCCLVAKKSLLLTLVAKLMRLCSNVLSQVLE